MQNKRLILATGMSVKQSTMKTWWFKNHWIYIHTVFHYNEPFVHLKGTMNDKRFFIEPYMPIKNLYTYTLLQSGIDKSTNLWSLSKNSFNIQSVYTIHELLFLMFCLMRGCWLWLEKGIGLSHLEASLPCSHGRRLEHVTSF